MNSDALIVNVVAAILIMFGFWWFFGNDISAFWEGDHEITILVKDGRYQPSLIQAMKGQPLKLRFIREDSSACAGFVFFPELKETYQLPMGKPVVVNIPLIQTNEIKFMCQMGLFEGKIVAT